VERGGTVRSLGLANARKKHTALALACQELHRVPRGGGVRIVRADKKLWTSGGLVVAYKVSRQGGRWNRGVGGRGGGGGGGRTQGERGAGRAD